MQSFGFGGANSHVILDDAYNFLRSHGLQGNHNTLSVPPKAVRDIIELPKDEPAQTNGYSNGIIENSDHHAITSSNFPKLLVWSTLDESGIGRVKDVWAEYFKDLGLPEARVPGFIRDLAHTLADRRSHFPWRSFVVAKKPDDLLNLTDQFNNGIRVKSNPKVAFVFSGVRNSCQLGPIRAS